MRRVLIFITILFLCAFVISGCITSHSFFYDYDELTKNLIKAEIIYMESEVNFFKIHWYADVEEIDYEYKKELTYDETRELIKALSNIEFKYKILWIPASVSNSFFMQGYGIKLYYEPDLEINYGSDRFIILAQTGDYGYGMRRLAQVRAGRKSNDENWNALISEFYFD